MESGARWDLFKSEDFIDEDEDGANDKAKGTNPLHWASFNGHTRVVWLLIKFGL